MDLLWGRLVRRILEMLHMWYAAKESDENDPDADGGDVLLVPEHLVTSTYWQPLIRFPAWNNSPAPDFHQQSGGMPDIGKVALLSILTPQKNPGETWRAIRVGHSLLFIPLVIRALCPLELKCWKN